jgi:hypothetical protein
MAENPEESEIYSQLWWAIGAELRCIKKRAPGALSSCGNLSGNLFISLHIFIANFYKLGILGNERTILFI